MSGVFQTTKLLTTHPLSTQRVCPPPVPKAGGGHTLRAVRGWKVNISEDARLWIGLLQYNPSTGGSLYYSISVFLFARYHNPVASSHVC